MPGRTRLRFDVEMSQQVFEKQLLPEVEGVQLEHLTGVLRVRTESLVALDAVLRKGVQSDSSPEDGICCGNIAGSERYGGAGSARVHGRLTVHVREFYRPVSGKSTIQALERNNGTSTRGRRL